MKYFLFTKPEVLKIVVIDYVYLEFGYDKEALRAAIIKWNVDEDEEFEPYMNGLDVIRDSSFLNI